MTLLYLPIGIVLFSVLLWTVYRRTDIGFILLLLGEAFQNAFGLNAVAVGGLHLTPSDAVAMILLFAGIVRTAQSSRQINLDKIIILTYVALLGFSLLRGMLSFDLTTVGNESRIYVGSLAALLYFTTVRVDAEQIQKYVFSYIVFGLVLCLIAAGSAAGLPVGISSWEGADLAAINGRLLPASGAAAMAVCGLLSLGVLQYRRSSLLNKLLPVLFFVLVIYLRHRTAWVMLLVCFSVMPFIDFRLFRRILPFGLMAVAVVAISAVFSSGNQNVMSKEQFSDAVSNGGTFAWRLNGWKELLVDDEQGAFSIAVGKKIGSGFWRIDPSTYQPVSVVPHNEYIQDYLRVGVLGVTALLLFAVRSLKRLWALSKYSKDAVYPSTSSWVAIFIAVLAYGFTYGISPHLYAMLGIASAITTNAEQQSTAYEEDESSEWPELDTQSASGEMA
jgi:hypothetical protein